MKRNLKLAAFAIVAMFAMASCENEEMKEMSNIQPEANAYTALADELNAYTAEFMKTATVTPTTKGDKKTNWWIVAVADLSGAVNSSNKNWQHRIINAVICSYDSYQQQNDGIKVRDDIRPSYILDKNAVRVITTDSIGYYHNNIICNLLNKYAGTPMTLEDIIDKTLLEATAFNIVIASDEIDKIKAELKISVPNISGKSIEEMCAYVKQNNPDLAEEADIIYNAYLENATQLHVESEVVEYSQNVRNIIERSDLTAESKARIAGSLSVAPNSYALWSNISK